MGWQNDPQPKERVKGEIVHILNKFLPESYDREIFLRKSTLVFDHMMSGNYEAEQKKLKTDVIELQMNIEAQERQNERLEKFIQKAKHYQDLDSLTPDSLRDMVSAIYVGAPDKPSGKRQQKIEIYYDGAGFIPLNLLIQRETA